MPDIPTPELNVEIDVSKIDTAIGSNIFDGPPVMTTNEISIPNTRVFMEEELGALTKIKNSVDLDNTNMSKYLLDGKDDPRLEQGVEVALSNFVSDVAGAKFAKLDMMQFQYKLEKERSTTGEPVDMMDRFAIFTDVRSEDDKGLADLTHIPMQLYPNDFDLDKIPGDDDLKARREAHEVLVYHAGVSGFAENILKNVTKDESDYLRHMLLDASRAKAIADTKLIVQKAIDKKGGDYADPKAGATNPDSLILPKLREPGPARLKEKQSMTTAPKIRGGSQDKDTVNRVSKDGKEVDHPDLPDTTNMPTVSGDKVGKTSDHVKDPDTKAPGTGNYALSNRILFDFKIGAETGTSTEVDRVDQFIKDAETNNGVEFVDGNTDLNQALQDELDAGDDELQLDVDLSDVDFDWTGQKRSGTSIDWAQNITKGDDWALNFNLSGAKGTINGVGERRKTYVGDPTDLKTWVPGYDEDDVEAYENEQTSGICKSSGGRQAAGVEVNEGFCPNDTVTVTEDDTYEIEGFWIDVGANYKDVTDFSSVEDTLTENIFSDYMGMDALTVTVGGSLPLFMKKSQDFDVLMGSVSPKLSTTGTYEYANHIFNVGVKFDNQVGVKAEYFSPKIESIGGAEFKASYDGTGAGSGDGVAKFGVTWRGFSSDEEAEEQIEKDANASHQKPSSEENSTLGWLF